MIINSYEMLDIIGCIFHIDKLDSTSKEIPVHELVIVGVETHDKKKQNNEMCEGI